MKKIFTLLAFLSLASVGLKKVQGQCPPPPLTVQSLTLVTQGCDSGKVRFRAQVLWNASGPAASIRVSVNSLGNPCYAVKCINVPGCSASPCSTLVVFSDCFFRPVGCSNGVDTPHVVSISPFPDCICGALSVKWGTVTAVRSGANVFIKWETLAEQNCRGFYIEKNTNGNWQEISFVSSIAVGGNSDLPLNYFYTDRNTEKGITQYRIRQIDFDGKFKYSEVHPVFGKDQTKNLLIYPNPSADGNINVILSNRDDIKVVDVYGRIIFVKKYNGNGMQITLQPGFYFFSAGGETQKVIVSKN